MGKNRIYFIRHGESEANLKGIFAGQREDSPLTQKGKEQAKLAAKDLLKKRIRVKKIYVSPLIRSRETAITIIKELGLKNVEVIYEKRIIEYDMGSLTSTSIRKVTSHELTSAEGAENPAAFMDRVHNLLEELQSLEENVLIVSHAGVGRIIEAKKTGKDPAEFYDLEPYPNAKIVRLF